MSGGSNDLRAFLAELAGAGELRTVRAEVDAELEVAAIVERVVKAGGPALRFERVRGYSVPLCVNLFGSERRMAQALGAESLDAAATLFAAQLQTAGSGNGAERLSRLLAGTGAAQGEAPWGGVPGRLGDIPALRSWPGDGGRHLTLPLVVTRDPATGRCNYGLYRIQLRDDASVVIHWRATSGAARHLAAWAALGKAMPVAVVLGAPPALLWAASTPLSHAFEETAFARLISGAALPLASCQESDLAVPQAAEMLIEGTVSAGETAFEGPFGNHSGHYAAAAQAPLLRVHGIRRRPDMLYPCTVVGPPVMEDCFLARATERLWLPLLRCDCPEVVDIHMPLATIFHNCALVAVAPGGRAGRALLEELWQSDLFKNARLLVLVAAGTPLHDFAVVYWQVVNRLAPETNLYVSNGRVGIVACDCDLGPAVGADAATAALVESRWREYGFSGESS
jgi:4-hydroxy-3-polyprenylbenzoate decarboxylase